MRSFIGGRVVGSIIGIVFCVLNGSDIRSFVFGSIEFGE